MITKRLLAAAFAAVVLLAVAWVLPAPFADPQSVVRGFLGPQTTTVLVIGLAAVGLVTALLRLVTGAGPAQQRLIAVVALVEVLALGVALQTVTTIALAGYLLAMALPFGLLVIAVQAVRRYHSLRWVVVAVVALVIALGVVSGVLRVDHLVTLAQQIGHGFAASADKMAVVVALALGTATWALVLAGSIQQNRTVQTVGDWVSRHRRGITLVAAAGPLPYALVRATWLTPWPLLVPAEIDPETRLWGLLLGGSALLGSVLTVGLLRPWGVTFPRWVPWLAGRPVPVRAAAVPAGLVAGIVTAAAAPMLRGIFDSSPGTVFDGASFAERLLLTGIFPFWLWGPALALATWAYVQWRRQLTATRTRAPEFATAGE
jgi:hypothetical protein